MTTVRRLLLRSSITIVVHEDSRPIRREDLDPAFSDFGSGARIWSECTSLDVTVSMRSSQRKAHSRLVSAKGSATT